MVLIEKSGHILRLLSLPFHILMSNSINRKYNVPSHTHTQAQVTMHIDAKHSLAEKKAIGPIMVSYRSTPACALYARIIYPSCMCRACIKYMVILPFSPSPPSLVPHNKFTML